MTSISIIDSGVGGATVVKEILKRNLNYNITCVADQKEFPYGEKSQQQINNRIKQIIDWVIELKPKCIVIACNSATVNSIKELRKHTKIPIIGIEPVIKPLTRYKSSLLLATKTTLEAKSTQDLLNNYKPQNIYLYSPPNLAEHIENMDKDSIAETLKNTKERFNNDHIQAIGLSCTHYPLITNEVSKHFPEATIIDPSEAVVNRILEISPPTKETQTTQINWYTTGKTPILKKQIQYYIGINTNPKTASITTR